MVAQQLTEAEAMKREQLIPEAIAVQPSTSTLVGMESSDEGTVPENSGATQSAPAQSGMSDHMRASPLPIDEQEDDEWDARRKPLVSHNILATIDRKDDKRGTRTAGETAGEDDSPDDNGTAKEPSSSTEDAPNPDKSPANTLPFTPTISFRFPNPALPQVVVPATPTSQIHRSSFPSPIGVPRTKSFGAKSFGAKSFGARSSGRESGLEIRRRRESIWNDPALALAYVARLQGNMNDSDPVTASGSRPGVALTRLGAPLQDPKKALKEEEQIQAVTDR
ncbi:hypothetical protein M427DRAFT_237144 [Gonapodya prolifera JEL478]|uniref:Uncharacterized protein n=1 Tax=Gonapodya prolifera (strain JEL478) TaxID=1344416 RepID=A0A139AML3_GONPJ|nr:hypothetical protein M427DRAFT_237144 [Gonapodya prolifera JEL478]|eukprot:KXS18006.1 hypothetical protein M427DRAFT_237144 [Gonapodya prolifera JEL478]